MLVVILATAAGLVEVSLWAYSKWHMLYLRGPNILSHATCRTDDRGVKRGVERRRVNVSMNTFYLLLTEAID